MLPDLRFVFGALMVLALTGMIGVGLFVSARLFHQAKMGPLESRRNLAFTDSAEWNQFYEPGGVRRFVGLAPQGDAQEIKDVPPEHRPEATAPAPVADAFKPAELPKQADDAEAVPAARPTAETVADNLSPSVDRPTTVAAPSMPDQVRETPPAERSAVLSADTVVDTRPAAAEVMHLPQAGNRDGAVTAETENGPDRELADAVAVDARDTSEPAAVTGRVDTAPRSSAALAKAAPVPVARTPVKRAVPDDDDEPVRPRASSRPQPRAPTSRPRAAAPQWNGTQRADPRQPPPGQPVFGPHFPYATPQPGQPQFGPHFPYATPQSNRQSARAPQYAQPSYDPRQLAPQRYAPQAAPRQPSYGPAYWR